MEIFCVLSLPMLEQNWRYILVNKSYCVGKQGQEKKEKTEMRDNSVGSVVTKSEKAI